MVNYVMGPLVGLCFSEDDRENEPYFSAAICHEKLLQAGFSCIEAHTYDGNRSKGYPIDLYLWLFNRVGLN